MNIVWFRNDLRVAANPALEAAQSNGLATVALVCLTPDSWSGHNESPLRMGLWRDRLLQVKGELESLNVPLKVIEAGHFDRCASAIKDLATELSATHLFSTMSIR